MKQMKKWGLLSFILLVMMAIVVGCNSEEVQTETNEDSEVSSEAITKEEEENKDENSNDSIGGQQFPVSVIDGTGQEVTIEKEPKTIVSLQASNTEVSFALGLEEKIVGVSDFCNYPAEALEVDKVGAQDMNVELILSMLPDLALVSAYHYNNHAEILNQFKDAGINVIVVGDASNFNDVYEKIELIGAVTGATAEAEVIVTDMQKRLETVKGLAKEVTEQKKIWVEVAPAPDIFTTGQGTFMHEMLEVINAINAAGEHEGWVMLTEEEIVQLNPDVIITTYGSYYENPEQSVLSRDGWSDVSAIKSEQVFDVEGDIVVRPGPRLIEGVEHIAKYIYPEIFN